MGPLFSQLSNAAVQALTQFAKSPGAKYLLTQVVKEVTRKL